MWHTPGSGRRTGRHLAAAALCALLAGACGPGGNNTLAIPTPFGGLVKVPAGSPSLAKPTLLARVQDFLLPRANALTGMEVVGAGVPVSLYAIDEDGNRLGGLLAQSTTGADGAYSVTLPSWSIYDRSHPWVVAVGDPADGTLMRRLVDDLAATGVARDIDPASEAAVRLLLEDATRSPLSEITPAELAEFNDQVSAAADAVSGLTTAEVVDLALAAARDNDAVQRRLVQISRTAENTRPLARAGIDFRMTTGDTLNLLGNAEDADGDLVSYLWTVDQAPAASSISRTPPIGRLFTFRADVDGTYVLKLVVSDGNLAEGPPDYATIIATTPPVQLTGTDRTEAAADSEGGMNRVRNLLVYTTSVRDASNNANYSDVHVRQISDIGPQSDPQVLLPPGATGPADVARTVDGHPAISSDGTMIVFSTDMVSPGVGGGDFEVVAVPVNDPAQTFWVTQNTNFDTQPDVQCVTPQVCVVVYVSDADPAGAQIHSVTYTDTGFGFVETARIQLTTDATDHFNPRLSPDGLWVVYVARDLAEGDLELFRTLADGSLAVSERLTDNAVDDEQPDPDLDASVVVFRRGNTVYALHTDGSPLAQLSPNPLRASHPAIAADGSRVAFVGETDFGTDLFSVLADGSRLTQLTTDGTVSQPRVAYDGAPILFRSARDGDHDFYLR